NFPTAGDKRSPSTISTSTTATNMGIGYPIPSASQTADAGTTFVNAIFGPPSGGSGQNSNHLRGGLSHSDLRANSGASQMCARIKSHTYDGS
ncbi:hypothetical protein ACJX0J_027158, partial [Zea mays]